MTHPTASLARSLHFPVMLLTVFVLGSGVAPRGDDELPQLCRLILHEETSDREDYALELDLARTQVQATEDIFVLVDKLWKVKAHELLSYLGYRHDRDFALVDEKRAELVLGRQDTLLEESRLVCRALASGKTTKEQRNAIAEAHGRYLTLDCERLVQRVEMAKVDLDYAERVREAYIDLREFAAAAPIKVMEWNYEVEVATKKLVHAKRRATSCRAALGGPTKKGE